MYLIDQKWINLIEFLFPNRWELKVWAALSRRMAPWGQVFKETTFKPVRRQEMLASRKVKGHLDKSHSSLNKLHKYEIMLQNKVSLAAPTKAH